MKARRQTLLLAPFNVTFWKNHSRALCGTFLFWLSWSCFHVTIQASSPPSLPFLEMERSTPMASAIPETGIDTDSTTKSSHLKNSIKIVFSDVDGTLVHYPPQTKATETLANILRLPPSTTGMQGIISSTTLVLCRSIRQSSTKLVLVSGMRTHTLWKRLPFLPKADAYCSEAGGRIFYPVPGSGFGPQTFEGATSQDLKPFTLVEDLEWRRQMQQTCGSDGYVGHELESFWETTLSSATVPVDEREGALWDFARELIRRGLVLDTKGYSCCFRINLKQQPNDQAKELFAALQRGDISHPPTLASSTNLGCVDFYPADSGKKNCCQYLLTKLSDSNATDLKRHALCLCDDDNDLEMAMACQHAFLPGISSDSMANTIKQQSDQFTLTVQEDLGIVETRATEKALSLVLDRLGSSNSHP